MAIGRAVVQRFIIYILFFVGALFGIVEYSFSLIPYGFIIGVLSIPLFVFFGLIYRAIRGKWSYWYFGLSLIVITALISSSLIYRVQYTDVKQNADLMVAAIDNYYQIHKNYPNRLEDLVEVQLTDIPNTGYGFVARSFRYSTSISYGYYLSYEAPFGTTYWYSPHERSWHADD